MKIIQLFILGITTILFLNCKNKNNCKNDTEKISKNHVLFLRPDDRKFESAKDESGIYEVDSDFGFAVQNAIDSLNFISKYKNINSSISTKRYIEIDDCKDCPQKIDRDTIWYGMILTAPGRDIKIVTGVQTLNYLPAIDEYFK
ncbi:MAG: hypothetical protein QM727_08840 [Niabella sp.]